MMRIEEGGEYTMALAATWPLYVFYFHSWLEVLIQVAIFEPVSYSSPAGSPAMAAKQAGNHLTNKCSVVVHVRCISTTLCQYISGLLSSGSVESSHGTKNIALTQTPFLAH
jgi:hypothetical protein